MPIVEGTHYIYRVRPGDTLYSIAARLGSAVQLIDQTNALYPPITKPGLIFPGQVLVVSEAGLNQQNTVLYIVSPGDSLYQISARFSAIPDLIAGLNHLQNPNLITINQSLTVPAFIYEVEKGDTLFSIARRFGLSLSSLLQANKNRPGISLDMIFLSYRLIIPLPISANIVVFKPLPGTRITPGQILEGFARAFEAVIQYQIRDDNGHVVIKEKTLMTLEGAPAYGKFSTVLQFENQPTIKEGKIWVYTRSARDGSIQDLTEVKVSF